MPPRPSTPVPPPESSAVPALVTATTTNPIPTGPQRQASIRTISSHTGPQNQGNSFIEAPAASPASGGGDVVLEESLMKRGSRGRWQERYFWLSTDYQLCYSRQRGQPAKATYELSQLPEVEISELYVAKKRGPNAPGANHNGLLYCVKITWNTDGGSVSPLDESLIFSDNDSAGSVDAVAEEEPPPQQPMDPTPDSSAPEEGGTLQHRRRGIFRKGRKVAAAAENHHQRGGGGSTPVNTTPGTATELQSRTPPRARRVLSLPGASSGAAASTPVSNNHAVGAGQRSVDQESLTIGTRVIRTQRSEEENGNGIPQIPSMVEVEDSGEGDEDNWRNARLWKQHNEIQDERAYLKAQYFSTEKENKRKTKRKVAEGAKFAVAAGATVGVAVVTVGLGLVAGLVALGVGAAAGGSSAAVGATWRKKKEGEIIIGSSDYEQMRRWKAVLDASLQTGCIQKSKWGQIFVGEKRKVTLFPAKNIESRALAPKGVASSHAHFHSNAKWRPLEGGWTSFLGTGPQGLRIFREERNDNQAIMKNHWSVDGRPCPPLKAHTVLNATAIECFLCLMSYGQMPSGQGKGRTPLSPNSGQRASFRIVETIDDNTDVIHLVCNPLFLFPSWTTARDFVLYRYWRLQEDGSFIVCYESVQHKDCPPHPSFCRGEMHQVYTISPHKKQHRRRVARDTVPAQECLMTAVVQVDPKGWVPIWPVTFLADQGYGDAFAVAALMQLLDVRDAIDQDRFVPVSFDDHDLQNNAAFFKMFAEEEGSLPQSVVSMEDDVLPVVDREDPVNYDFTFANRESIRIANRESIRSMDSPTGLTSNPPTLDRERWAEPDPNSFRVRGKTYKVDRKKINAGESIGRLFAVDVIQVDSPIYSGLTMHPTERFQLALKKDRWLRENNKVSDMPPFIFVVNIVLPGPPFYHGVFYYAVDDMATIDGSDGSPSSLLCKEFFFGESDEFRDKTFKLIPQIVEGNFIVRKAVGSTPAIIGKKLRQTYVRTERSCEIVLDCGSSSVATGVIRISLGYAKTLVVDMGFLLEGGDESRLPERLFGCARIRQLEFGPFIRKVSSPGSTSEENSPSL